MATVNIPSYLDDPNYRYKMPKLKAKIEGRGNGIKTNIMNMGDIARSLKRPPEYPTKFCGCELGSASKFEGAEGKAIVNGAHTEADLQLLIDKFIDKFVLCPNCRLPEVDLMVSKNRVKGKCNACGFSGDMDNAHKVGTYILKNPPDGGDSTMGKKASKKSKEERQKERALKARAKEDGSDAGDEDPVSAGKDEESGEKKHRHKSKKTDKEKSAGDKEKKDRDDKKKKEKKKEKKSSSTKTKSAVTTHGSDDNSSTVGSEDKSPAVTAPSKDVLDFDSEEIHQVISRLTTFLHGNGERPTPSHFFQEVRLLQVAQDFDSVLRVYVSLCSLFPQTLDVQTFKARLPHLQAICDRSVSGDNVLEALEEFAFRHANGASGHYARLCSELYHADMVEEEVFLTRYKANTKKASSTAFEKAREAAAPFTTWLSEAESASDSSGSGSE
eukprot:Gregarina_sp_Pseudo_9__408@NODE_1268_length_1728_cov_55_270574_g1192_i0_p1_GENE_NODE_1268_length_1728_cov_55_270574_g1192_i0NODE_1268_length_1728_cov_55_270574_g1192_i0_p1_ORF_typecomplete_len442_score118_38eIF5_eIF2B/PF01873_17/3_3e38W2/PF02020_18/1_5e04W2/PF02020_18/4_7e13TFIIF_alpha/PF05793_12/0_012RhoGAP/PF00620_27/0_027RNA_polI_A34/PF08208_11/0_091Borrelia_P83/PF05262_11/0_07TIMELESS_C/PF05029_13/0_11SOBP/PF15279_6/1_7Spore_coat_CotO/PF14153_6/15DDRGK/PF09756_9/23_NODE_1268_length_1728_cov_